MAKILLLVAQTGFQAKEFSDTKHSLIERGHDVFSASRDGGIALSSSNEELQTDMSLNDVVVADYAGVFVIGGPGCLTYLSNDETIRILTEAKSIKEMLYGAICVGPRILAKAGLLEGIRITGWDNDGKLGAVCDNARCIREMRDVIIDGRVVTANGPAAALDFGHAIADALSQKS